MIAQKSTQEEPQKAKRTGFLGIFGKKEKPKPTTTTTMLYTLNRDMIAQQQAQSRQLSEYADSLAIIEKTNKQTLFFDVMPGMCNLCNCKSINEIAKRCHK